MDVNSPAMSGNGTPLDADAKQASIFLGMAASAEAAANQQEALSYYTRALEIDPTLSEAWLGKGRSAGWLSSLKALRVTETIVAGGHAIATAPEADRPAIAARAMSDLTAIAGAMHRLARDHDRNFRQVASARSTYRVVGAGLIDALAAARAWQVSDRAPLDLTITICRDLLGADPSPGFAQLLRERSAQAQAEIDALNPDEARRRDEAAATEATAKAKDDRVLFWIVVGAIAATLAALLILGQIGAGSAGSVHQ